jgi:hypothetical protein
MTSLVDTHISPLLLPEAIECIPAWGLGPPKLEASATWLPEDLLSNNNNKPDTLFSLPPLINSLTSFQVTVHRNLYPSFVNICKASVSVKTDSIIIDINSTKSIQKCITLTTANTTANTTVTVYDVLHALQDKSTWNSCHLVLGPPSNIASPLAASDDPNIPYDSTPRFLEPGDWVDMGDRRIECDDDDIKIISMKNGSHDIMKLNPRSIHGGYFEITIN